MASLVLVTGTDPAALLEAAAADFLVPRRATDDTPWPTPGTWLVLRQGGLRDDLLRLAARHGVPGWFDPPLALFAELGERLDPTLPRPVDPLERRVLVEEALRHVAPAGIGRTDRLQVTARETDALIGELLAEGCSVEAFERACAARGDRDAFQEARDAAVAAAWRRVAHGLATRGLRDGRDTLARLAATVAADPAALAAALGGRRVMHIVGLMDLKGGWRPLLRALQASPALDRVALYTMQAALLDGEALVADDRERAGPIITVAARLFTDLPAVSGDPPAVAAWDMPDDRRALEWMAVWVRRQVFAGTPMHRIAVVAREARPLLEQAADALDAVGVPVTMRRRTGLPDVASVRLVRLLLMAAAEGWTRHALVELAEHPLFRSGTGTGDAPRLDAAAINALGYDQPLVGLDAWRAALGGDFAAFADRAQALDAQRPLRAWVALVRDLVAHDPWEVRAALRRATADTAPLAHADERGWNQLERLLSAWHDALGEGTDDARDAASMGAAEFLRLFDAIVQGDLATPPATVHGVQLLEALSAAYRDFDHVFVLGLNVQRFPRVRVPGQLLDDEEREALVAAGLPLDPRGRWPARERELFRAVVAGARRSLTLFSSREADGAREAVESSFVDAVGRAADEMTRNAIASSTVSTPAFPLAASPAAVEHADAMAEIERLRLTGADSAWHGRIEDEATRAALARRFATPQHVWSPTSLETLATCGFQWLHAKVLKLETLEDPDDDASARARGTVLHAALKRFFDAEREARGGAPVFLTPERLAEAGDRVAAAFDAAFDAVAATTWLGAPALRTARRAEWCRMFQRYLAAEAAQRAQWQAGKVWQHRQWLHTGVFEHERAFGPLDLDVLGLPLRVRGTMDRVEVGVDARTPDAERFRVVVDYKTTAGSVPGGGKRTAYDDGIVIQLPLYGLVLRALEPEAQVARLEYRALSTGDEKLGLRLAQFDSKGQALEPGPHGETYAKALMAIRRAAERALTGDFRVAPAPTAGCSPYCSARDTCRIPGGPRTVRPS